MKYMTIYALFKFIGITGSCRSNLVELLMYTHALHTHTHANMSRGNHSHSTSGIICNRDQNETKRSTSKFILNQAIKEYFKEAIKQLVEE